VLSITVVVDSVVNTDSQRLYIHDDNISGAI
jgi:hypothetical protein